MEYWSLYDSNMIKRVEKHKSTDVIPKGLYHLSVEVWPFDGQRFFLTKRSATKKRYPGFWECTGGSALAGESFVAAAVREVREELGIVTEEKDYDLLSTEVKDTHIVSVFLLRIRSNKEFDLSNREIDEGKWYTLQELESLHLDTSFIPYQFQRYLSHVRDKAFRIYMKNKPHSIQRVVNNNIELSVPKRGLSDAGKRPDTKAFSGIMGDISTAFKVYGDDLYTKKTVLAESVNNSLGGGSPLPMYPFPPVVDAIYEELKSTTLSQYAFPAGDIVCRRSVCEYLYKESFSRLISTDNIIFTESTTQAFHMILELLIRPGDVVLFTSPTYGLFAFEPERCGGNSRFIPLSGEDDWLVSPERLAETIDTINEELESEASDTYKPKVVAYFQENPHNPLGKVMGKKEATLVKAIAKTCRERGVFLIDDLLYKDLVYDQENSVLPAAYFDDEYQNVISLLGLSKAYGLAGLRAGVVVADEVIIRGIRNIIFQEIDSASQLNAVALKAAFNISDEREKHYRVYFDDLLAKYTFNLNLVKAAVEGINSVSESCRLKIIEFVVDNCESQEKDEWLQPIEGVSFVPGTYPESGFFCLLDFTRYKGKKCEDIVINDDIDLLKFLFSKYRINFITGTAMGWPDKNAIIARISFSYEPSKIVRVFSYLKKELKRLEQNNEHISCRSTFR